MKAILSILFLIIFNPQVYSSVYKAHDKNGNVIFSDQPIQNTDDSTLITIKDETERDSSENLNEPHHEKTLPDPSAGLQTPATDNEQTKIRLEQEIEEARKRVEVLEIEWEKAQEMADSAEAEFAGTDTDAEDAEQLQKNIDELASRARKAQLQLLDAKAALRAKETKLDEIRQEKELSTGE